MGETFPYNSDDTLLPKKQALTPKKIKFCFIGAYVLIIIALFLAIFGGLTQWYYFVNLYITTNKGSMNSASSAYLSQDFAYANSTVSNGTCQHISIPCAYTSSVAISALFDTHCDTSNHVFSTNIVQNPDACEYTYSSTNSTNPILFTCLCQRVTLNYGSVSYISSVSLNIDQLF